MNEAGRLIERLSESLDAHVDPEIACVDVGSQLAALRQVYKLQPSAFTHEMIEGLKRVSRLNEDIRELSFLMEDAREAKYKEYAQETANALARIAQCLQGMKLAELAKARVRELRARIPTMRPEQDGKMSLLERQRRVEAEEHAAAAAELWKALSVLAPRCQRCGVTMVLRGGRYGDFWGCHGYPECTGTQNLSQEAKSKLASVRAAIDIREDTSSLEF